MAYEKLALSADLEARLKVIKQRLTGSNGDTNADFVKGHFAERRAKR